MNIKSNTVQNTMVISCMQKKVEIMSNTIQNTMVINCMLKKAKIKSNSIQNIMRVTCMQKKVKIESNSPQNMQKKLKNKSLQNALEDTCKKKRLNTKSNSSQMCPQVTFSVWISEIFSRAKSYILSLSLTASNWGKFLKHWHAFEVSLSLFWNNSNVFS